MPSFLPLTWGFSEELAQFQNLCRWTKASLAIAFQVSFSLCSVPLRSLTMFFWRALPNKSPKCKSFHQSRFSGVPEQRQCPTVFYIFIGVCFLIFFFCFSFLNLISTSLRKLKPSSSSLFSAAFSPLLNSSINFLASDIFFFHLQNVL